MSNEYVGIGPSEQNYAKKNLLYSEMELLTVLKRYKRYKKLRKEELALKKLLSKVINEIHEEIKKFNESIPHIKEEKYLSEEISGRKKQRSELEDEIDEIRRKIAELQ